MSKCFSVFAIHETYFYSDGHISEGYINPFFIEEEKAKKFIEEGYPFGHWKDNEYIFGDFKYVIKRVIVK